MAGDSMAVIRAVWGHDHTIDPSWRKALPVEAYNATVRLAQEHIAALLARVAENAAEIARLRAALEGIAAHQPYPADVFTPLTAQEEEAVRAALRASGVRHPLDRTYAEWGRAVLRQTAEMARVALGEEG